MNEILLTPEEIETDYRELKAGETVRLGDLFQRHPGWAMPAATGEPTRFRFEIVAKDTIAGAHTLAGLLYLPSYPVVLRARHPAP